MFKNYFYSAWIGAGGACLASTIANGFEWYFWPVAVLLGAPVAAIAAGIQCLASKPPPDLSGPAVPKKYRLPGA